MPGVIQGPVAQLALIQRQGQLRIFGRFESNAACALGNMSAPRARSFGRELTVEPVYGGQAR